MKKLGTKQSLPVLCMMLKDKNSAEEIEKSIMVMKAQGKPLLVNFCKEKLPLGVSLDVNALFDSLVQHVESKLDCKEYFEMYQKVLANNKKASTAFFSGDMVRALTLLANGGDESGECTPKQLAAALADEFRLAAAIYKIGLNIFSEAPKDTFVMLFDSIAKNVPTKEMISGGPCGDLSEEEYTQILKAWKFPLNRDALQSACLMMMKKIMDMRMKLMKTSGI